MPVSLYDIFHFTAAKKDSAHVIHKKTIQYINGKATHVVTKENKHRGTKGENLSILEAGFTAIANLFTQPKHALRQDIIMHESKVFGITSLNAAHILPEEPLQNSKIVDTRTKEEEKYNLVLKATLTWQDDIDSIPVLKLAKKYHASLGDVQDILQYLPHLLSQRMKLDVPTVQKKFPHLKDEQDIKLIQEIIETYQTKEMVNVIARKVLNTNSFPSKKALEELKNGYHMNDAVFDKAHAIAERKYRKYEQLQINRQQNIETAITITTRSSDYFFLKNKPQNFFSELMDDKEKGLIDIDMESLASVFTTAYTLEEDDLHKDNIGVYITQKDGKDCYHFFKIDHDLMFNEKIMAQQGEARIQNVFSYSYAKDMFRITKNDLINFPDIHNGAHYWPTKHAWTGLKEKGYNTEERHAFKALKHDEAFQKAKWKQFLKQAITPSSLVDSCLQVALGEEEQTQTAKRLIKRCTLEKISELTLALIQVEEFREFMKNDPEKIKQDIIEELTAHARSLGLKDESIKNYELEIIEVFTNFQLACDYAQGSSFSSLHASILTRSYRCHETLAYFQKDLNKPDYNNKTAIELSLRLYEDLLSRVNPTDAEQDLLHYYASVVCDLKNNGAKYDTQFEVTMQKAMQDSKFQIKEVNTLEEFKQGVLAINKRPRTSLKQNKLDVLYLLQNAKLSLSELKQIRADLNPKIPKEPYAFVKELRNTLWIIKKLRGKYASTKTSSAIDSYIRHKISALSKNNSEEPVITTHQNPQQVIKQVISELKDRPEDNEIKPKPNAP